MLIITIIQVANISSIYRNTNYLASSKYESILGKAIRWNIGREMQGGRVLEGKSVSSIYDIHNWNEKEYEKESLLILFIFAIGFGISIYESSSRRWCWVCRKMWFNIITIIVDFTLDFSWIYLINQIRNKLNLLWYWNWISFSEVLQFY